MRPPTWTSDASFGACAAQTNREKTRCSISTRAGDTAGENSGLRSYLQAPHTLLSPLGTHVGCLTNRARESGHGACSSKKGRHQLVKTCRGFIEVCRASKRVIRREPSSFCLSKLDCAALHVPEACRSFQHIGCNWTVAARLLQRAHSRAIGRM